MLEKIERQQNNGGSPVDTITVNSGDSVYFAVEGNS